MKGTDRYRVEGVSCRFGEREWPVRDLSVGGFFVESREPLPRGQSLRFELELPGGPRVPLEGVVTWVNDPIKPSKPARPPGFGVKIFSIEFPDKMRLLALLRELRPEALRAK
jgi:PilZ domain